MDTTATTQTSVDTGTTETATDTSGPIDLDTLLDAHFEGAAFDRDNWKGVDPKQVIEGLPADGQKLVQNLREDYRRKTTELANQKRELERREQSMLSQSQAKLKEQLNLPADLDIYQADGLQKFINAKVAEALLAQQQPLQEQYESAKRHDDLLAFKSAHPDIDSFKDDIINIITNREADDVKTAYWVAKGRAAETQATKLAAEARAAKMAQRQSATKVGIGAPVNVQPGQAKTAREAYAELKAKGLA